jgi:hypothetical protein
VPGRRGNHWVSTWALKLDGGGIGGVPRDPVEPAWAANAAAAPSAAQAAVSVQRERSRFFTDVLSSFRAHGKKRR